MTLDEHLKTLTGKSIAVVGNAPLVFDTSDRIDRNDVVMRFNCFGSENQRAGKAFTHWCVNLKRRDKDANKNPRTWCGKVRDRNPNVVVLTPFAEDRYGRLADAKKYYPLQGFMFVCPDKKLTHPLNLVDHQMPSVGFAMTWRLVMAGLPVALYGFTGNISRCHDGAQEISILKKHPLITFLDPHTIPNRHEEHP